MGWNTVFCREVSKRAFEGDETLSQFPIRVLWCVNKHIPSIPLASNKSKVLLWLGFIPQFIKPERLSSTPGLLNICLPQGCCGLCYKQIKEWSSISTLE
jgi:hypothetical protein